LQCVAVCYSKLVASSSARDMCVHMQEHLTYCVAVRCSVLQ